MAKTKIEIDTSQTTGDLVDQLLQQHEMVRTAINGVARTTTAESRQEAFDALRELLARHETAEEMIVRPLTRDIDNGEAVAEARMEEENESKDVLRQLEKLEIDSVEFARTFEGFAKSVLEHAIAEETYEFPLLRQLDPDKLEKAEKQFLMAEKTAPTHPPPSARSTAMNFVAGPFAPLADRARDAVSKART